MGGLLIVKSVGPRELGCEALPGLRGCPPASPARAPKLTAHSQDAPQLPQEPPEPVRE